MKRLMAALALSLVLGAPALAADRPLALTLDDRPISHNPTIAVLHDRVAYVDLYELVRSYSGLVTITRGATTVTIHLRTARYVPGKPTFLVDNVKHRLAGPAFIARGDLYVPLESFVRLVARGDVHVDKVAGTANIIAKLR